MTLRATLVLLLAGLQASFVRAQPARADELLERGKQAVFTQGSQSALADIEEALRLYREAGNRRGEAIATGYLGYCYKELGDFSKALDYLLHALKQKQRLGDRQEEGKTLTNLGLVYWKLGNYDQAIRTESRALALGRQIGDRLIEGSAWGNLGRVYHEQGDYQRSLDYFQRAREIHHASGFVRGETDALGNIGGHYIDLGRYREALPYYQQALEIDERENMKPSLSLDVGNLALCRAGMGEYPEALATYDRALALAHETGNKSDEADWHKGKGEVLLRLGKHDDALAEYRSAIGVYEQADLKRELVEALQELGNLHLTLGDPASAETEFRRAKETAQKIGHPRGETDSLLALGDLEWRRKRYREAAALYSDALTQSRTSGNRERTAASLVQLALIDKEQGRADRAQTEAREALDTARTNGLRPVESEALHALGEAERVGGKLDRALEHFTAGEAIARSLNDPELGWRFGYAAGQVLEALKRPQDAERAYERAVALIESVRSGLREERFRAGYLEDKYQVYVALVRLLLQLGRIQEAFRFSEKMRRQSYDALLSHSSPRVRPQAEQELRARILQLQRTLEQENSRPQSQRSGPQATGQISSELAAAERSYQNLIDDLRAADPDFAAAREASAPTVETLQGRLAAGDALIEYIVTDGSLGIFVLTAHGLHGTFAPQSAGDLVSKVELLRALLSRDGDWRKPAASLRRALIEPIEKAAWLAGIKRLYIVPHGALHYLPFGVLWQPAASRYLVEDYVVAYLPAAAALARRHRETARFDLFAEAPGRTRLPFAQEEVKSVGAFFTRQSQVLTGASATESSFKRDAGRYRFIHLATHGYFNKVNPLFSAVELEPGESEDGRLEVHEILSLRLNASLVTLSACDTALGSGYFAEVPAGDEFVGLTRAFLYAGSPAVLATLWEVSDRSTLVLMRVFYQALPRLGPAEALAQAQRAMLRQGGRAAQPYIWAPFVLVGEMK